MKIEDRLPEDGHTVDVCITRENPGKYRVRDGLVHLGYVYPWGKDVFVWETTRGGIYFRGQCPNFGLAVGEILSDRFDPGGK